MSRLFFVIARLGMLVAMLSQVASAQIAPSGPFVAGHVLGDSRNKAGCINGSADFLTYLKAYLPPNWAAATLINDAQCGQNLETTDFNYNPIAYPNSGWWNFDILVMSSVNSALGAPSGPGAPAVTPGGDSAATMYGYIQNIAAKALKAGHILVLGIEPAVGSLSPTQLAQYQQLQLMLLQAPQMGQYLVRLDTVFPTNVDPVDYFDATHLYTATGAQKIAQQIGSTISQQQFQPPYQCGDQCQIVQPPPPSPCVPGTAYSATLTGDSGPEAGNAFRSATTPTITGSGCGHVTVEFAASAAGGPMNVNHASICVQSSGSGCASAPVPLLVGGSASFTVAQGGSATSDQAAFSFTTGQVLLVSIDNGSPSNDRATGTGPGFYYCVGCATALQQNPAGLTTVLGQGPIGFDQVTVLQ